MNIKELTIYTSQLQAQKEFYCETLNFPLLNESSTSFSLAVGSSTLIFKYREQVTPYHIAINIPSYQDPEALAWLRKRIPVIKYEGKGLVDFVHWNARAIYFYDLDQNIVELIARKSLAIQSLDTFDHHAFLNISEVGMPTTDIEKCNRQIQQLGNLPIYDGDFNRFCALGDENGLFILIDKNKKKWFPADDEAFSSAFEIKFENDGESIAFQFLNEEVKPVPGS
ncbi:VOC family protein [Sunxiuqinia indica]|uniref:VOC family protein n=1 Tax=Sunxiuqinia indica TaxID=2692584 RepID=UPI00135C1084|nr:VOC family protein [Sunxiuqinia indica]